VFLTTLDSVSESVNEDPDSEEEIESNSPNPATNTGNDAIVASEFEDIAASFLTEEQLENVVISDGPLAVNTGAGDDLVIGSSQGDVIEGGSGNDVVFASAGDDQVTLGSGNDLYGSETVNPNLGSTDLGDDVVQGGLGDDVIIDLYGSNVLAGQGGNDIVNAIDAEETSTPDQISGGSGDDFLFIDSGDTAETGSGSDTVQALVTGDGSTDLITISDFSLLTDGLRLQGLSTDDEVTVQDTSADPTEDNQATIFVNGNPVIEVVGGRGLTVDDIILVP
jgi:Ca2+-binding RTX toxin-like protein